MGEELSIGDRGVNSRRGAVKRVVVCIGRSPKLQLM